MKIIGVTGNSGTGKSSVCDIIKQNRNAEIIDADKIVKKLQNDKTEYYKCIVETFGESILLEDLSINRKKLAEIIFSNINEKAKLDKITFKYVVDEIKNKIKLLTNQHLDYIVVDAPTLIEAGMVSLFDKIIVVISDENTKIDRICKRDGLNQIDARNRLSAQPNDDFYERYANFIIENNDNNLEKKVKSIIEKIEREN